MNVLEHTGAYATFPNLGKAVAPHAIVEVRSGNGEVVWRFDRDGKKPVQVLRPQVAMDMIFMMNKVVEEGTARRAILDGIKAAEARPAPPTLIATPGSWATPAISFAASGSAMTTIRRPTA